MARSGERSRSGTGTVPVAELEPAASAPVAALLSVPATVGVQAPGAAKDWDAALAPVLALVSAKTWAGACAKEWPRAGA